MFFYYKLKKTFAKLNKNLYIFIMFKKTIPYETHLEHMEKMHEEHLNEMRKMRFDYEQMIVLAADIAANNMVSRLGEALEMKSRAGDKSGLDVDDVLYALKQHNNDTVMRKVELGMRVG